MNSTITRRRTKIKKLIVDDSPTRAGSNSSGDGTEITVGQHIKFDARVLDIFDVEGCRAVHYDLLLICAAVEFADRRWARPQSWSRTFQLNVPVSDVAAWDRREARQALQGALRYLTGDQWEFTFRKAFSPAPLGQRGLPLDFAQSKTFAVPYSEGLDSRAVSALSGPEKEALCVRVANTPQRRKIGDLYFSQIPFKVIGHDSGESSFRSRGFQFAAVTAIAAQLSGVSKIVVPESGQGALGPAMLPLYGIHADYRNHPSFFRRMERFLTVILDMEVFFEQPRLWSTKGNTLRDFLALSGKTPFDLIATRSCWQSRWVVNVVGGRKQCGLCAACLLRRASMLAAQITEPENAYVIKDLGTSKIDDALSLIKIRNQRDVMIEYGSVGARHFDQLAQLSRQPDTKLRVYASEISTALDRPYSDTLADMREMLTEHASEWGAFLSHVGQNSFLRSWLDGGRLRG